MTTERAPRGDRRIIERPRLLRLLDDADARTLLLIAPAGYGKTTVVQQWLRGQAGTVFSAGLGAPDVAVLARGVATALAPAVPGIEQLVDDAVGALTNPRRQVEELAQAVISAIDGPLDTWLVIDDYHTMTGARAAERFVEILEATGRLRLLVASRVRPRWATTRRLIYGDIVEIGSKDLALTADETAEVLSDQSRYATDLLELARGWPAVIGLAALSGTSGVIPRDAVPAALYDFFAEEIFAKSSPAAQSALTRLALLPRVDRQTFAAASKADAAEAIPEALASGLAYEAPEVIEVHPLARAFLIAKVKLLDDADEEARAAFNFSIRHEKWDEAFDLIVEFALDDQLEPFILGAYRELLSLGRIATLERVGQYAAQRGRVPTPLVELINAEVSNRNGLLDRGRAGALLAADRLGDDHALKPRAILLAASAAHLSYDLNDALSLHTRALGIASHPRDINDALWGRCLALLYLEQEDALRQALAQFEEAPDSTAADRLRALVGRQHAARIIDGLGTYDADAAASAPLLQVVTDPRIRSSWANTFGYSLFLQARYDEAKDVLSAALAEIDRFGLGFARPHVQWTYAAAEAGVRRFSAADRHLRAVEAAAAESNNTHLELNSRALRGRLFLMHHSPHDAVAVTAADYAKFPTPAMYGEYLGTRALALAVRGERALAVDTANRVDEMTREVAARTLASAARAVASLNSARASDAAAALFDVSSRLHAWDPVICAIRAQPDLLVELAQAPARTRVLADLLKRTRDAALAKAAGLSLSVTYSREGPLSRREQEVMDLLRQGLRNAEIAKALYIAEPTVKVHVRHILEKLGARTRAEAVARYKGSSDEEPPTSGQRDSPPPRWR